MCVAILKLTDVAFRLALPNVGLSVTIISLYRRLRHEFNIYHNPAVCRNSEPEVIIINIGQSM